MSSIVCAILKHAQNQPDKLAVKVDDDSLTYSELADRIRLTAAHHFANGVTQGSRVVLPATMSLNFVTNYFASHYLGAVAVPIDQQAPKSNVESLLSALNTQFFLEKAEIFPKDSGIGPIANGTLSPNVVSHADADILFTSGSSGQAKGVRLTHQNILSSAVRINEALGNDSNDVELIIMPLCHSFGLTRLRCALTAGSSCVLLDGLTRPKKFFSKLDAEGISGFGTVPAGWLFIEKVAGERLKNYADQIKFLELGSSPMTEAQKQRVKDTLPHTRIVMHYGATEASRACFLDFERDRNNLGSVGKPTDPGSLRIVDEFGNKLGIGETGEVCVHGQMVSPGYVDPSMNSKRNSDFHRMGDTGYIDANGFLYLTGRISDLINIAGRKVSPQEVEEAIRSFSGVQDCACLAVDHEVSGSQLKALVVGDVDFVHLKEHLLANIEAYKIPAVFEAVKDLPYTVSGKLKRGELKAW